VTPTAIYWKWLHRVYGASFKVLPRAVVPQDLHTSFGANLGLRQKGVTLCFQLTVPHLNEET
jgi:hypothetical protein